MASRSARSRGLARKGFVATVSGVLLLIAAAGAIWGTRAGHAATAKADVEQIVAAVKAYQKRYNRSPIQVTAGAGEQREGWFQGPTTGALDNSDIVRVLAGENDNGLNPERIVFLATRPATAGNRPKSGVGPDGVFYDPWGTPYGIKVDSDANHWVEYYGPDARENVRTTAIAVSFGPNGIQQDISKTTDKGTRVDDIVSFH